MRTATTIFVGSDFVLDPALDEVAQALYDRGHRIIRGPKAVPGKQTIFAPGDYERYFGDIDVLVISSRSLVTAGMLAASPRLRGIVFPSIGTESLDLSLAKARDLIVANGATPENFESVAEATVMLMLNLFYDLKGTEHVLRAQLPRPRDLKATMLKGKTVGIIGFGRIGRGVAQRLSGWDIDILVNDPGLREQPSNNVTLAPLDELLRSSDIVTVHATPAADGTPIIGAGEVSRMKTSAFLVNTSRGRCLDETAVFEALRDNRIAGAALDAFLVEPLPAHSPLRDLDNVILTPHMIAHTRELFASFAPTCVENVERILQAKPPLYIRNPDVLERWQHRVKICRLAAQGDDPA
ncbi:NAD(P)-dependent oxidoreductase [Bradyrhizobium prioriisuperbiae]|uniref:NAD(P)-dependent oxidoreductase n=1 Tax=Bradyrhizobium prioriisuperbiae TaxID=2854389 RepID=UPI0028F15E15|nr:NAD(P)-dependent oxidoreductase [Bradyrhizobium prioritasuperba]